MFKNILVPTDGSELSQKSIAYALEFAKATDAKLVFVSVAVPYEYIVPLGGGLMPSVAYDENLQSLYDETSFKQAQAFVQAAEEEAKKSQVNYQSVTKTSFNPYEEIIAAAKDFNCDVIFMASHGRKGITQLFIGSETQKVLANSKVPVLVIR